MFTPHHSSQPSANDGSSDHTTSLVLTLKSLRQVVTVGHDGFSIGSSPRCDLVVADRGVPPLHSVIHMQSGAIWIQTADSEVMMSVNDQACCRMSLRHLDKLRIGDTEFTILLAPSIAIAVEQNVMTEDLALLTAEELCDRILSEQTMVAEFEQGQRCGWDALLRAIHEADAGSVLPQLPEVPEQQQSDIDAILGQIQELNETISDRTRDLSNHEAQVLSSSSMLEETHQRVSQRLDEILDQLNKTDPPNELRASA